VTAGPTTPRTAHAADRIGSIETGKLADLLIIDENPRPLIGESTLPATCRR
jgi:imidazolonepropionase-like amidohydrolase